MSLGTRVPLEQARELAARLGAELESLASRIHVAGSVRRQRPIVSDIEFVLEPRRLSADLFGVAGAPDVEPIQRLAESWGRIKRAGPRLIGIADVLGSGIDCELYLVHPPAQWGVILAIRTGPRELSQLAVSRMHRFRRRCEDGRVVDMGTGATIPCESEERFFELAGMSCLPARFRDTAAAGAPVGGR